MIGYSLDLLARLEFWWAKKTIKEDRDFRISLDECKNGDFVVEILKGKYSGIKVMYGAISVREDPYGNGLLDINANVIYNPNSIKPHKKLDRLITNIIRLILINSVKNEIRNSDIDELDEERNIREEDPPVRQARVPSGKPRKKAVSRDKGTHS